MRKKIVAGNWKMNMALNSGVELSQELLSRVGSVSSCEVVLCPPYPLLKPVADAIQGSRMKLGAQNLFWEDKGAFTGEVSADMLVSVGCTYVIIGHSERRAYFGETDETVNKKLKKALSSGLLPIVCVGETLEDRESRKTKTVIEKQIRGGLQDISENELKQVIIAYEPVWAIGTGKNATPEQAVEVHQFIRGLIAKLYNEQVADTVRIQYGGSVKAENAQSLLSQPDIDGALVGGASLKADQFAEIVKVGEQYSR